MEICYICGKQLSDNNSSETVKRHKEHIIHNGLYGRLKSSNILCEQCGSAYSKNDAKFIELFNGFIELLHNYLYAKDHGKDKAKRLRAYFNPEKENKTEVEYFVGKVYPITPYYEVNKDTQEVKIFAHKDRLKHFETVLLKENPELKEYKRILIDDISNKGNVGLFFSEKNPDFNTIFKDGITKIATEFALHNGINRNEITESLIIHSDNSASLDSSKTPIIPYTPSSISDLIFALVEDVINPYYPSHVIRLYTEINESIKTLICYVDLFSTFRYYVILNKNYTGADVDIHYAQRILIETDENGKQLNPIYDLTESLSLIMKNITSLMSNYLKCKELPDLCINKDIIGYFISNAIEEQGLEQVIKELVDGYNISNYCKNIIYHYDDAAPVIRSICYMSNEAVLKDINIVREYTIFKFNQLDRFCWNIGEFKRNNSKDS